MTNLLDKVMNFIGNNGNIVKGLSYGVQAMTCYVAWKNENLRFLAIETLILMNGDKINELIFHSLRNKYNTTTIENLFTILYSGKTIVNLNHLSENNTILSHNPINIGTYIVKSIFSLEKSLMIMTLFGGLGIIIGDGLIRRYIRNQIALQSSQLRSFRDLFQKINPLLDEIEPEVVANAIKNIGEGQSLHIDVIQNDQKISLISIPRRVAITEEKLEEICPKQSPMEGNYNLDNIQFNQESCSICQESFTESTKLIRILKCGHAYHCGCVDSWFFAGHLQCPICREPILGI